MQVSDLMATDVVTVDRDASLRAAVRELLENEVGSVIIVDDKGNPIGIVTESDALRAGYVTEKPFDEIAVIDLTHRPVITTKPSSTIRWVAKQMADNDVKKAPVMDDLELVGIITLTDIVWHLSDIQAEAGELAGSEEDWNLD
ncbi:CBS domain-containing protein [Halorhabdus salina]|uniref:CBS domain-containing protein n=1 Tax=Halorhabdus salina TaxID=2750670 RepID=UPI0015EEBB78|nr:CBS domain-containing protein [Halorhabdus salina]